MPHDEQIQLLAGIRHTQPSVAEQLSRLLAGGDDSSQFLERPIDFASVMRLAEGGSSIPALPGISEFHLVPQRIGQYEVLGMIGSGGMGVVYRAMQARPKRQVAIKVLRPGVCSPDVMRRFEHEAEILGRLRHAGIAQVLESGAAELVFANGATATRPFLAMEYVRGRSLTQYLVESPVELPAKLRLFVKICEAVHHAHQNGVIHRDLKPANILVSDEAARKRVGENGELRDSVAAIGSISSGRIDPSPKILDFGIARLSGVEHDGLTLQTAPSQMLGTIMYMSPEQLQGGADRLDTRADIYSLGVILFEMICGQLPYQQGDKSIPELIRQRELMEPRPLRSICTVPDDVATIVHKALERDRDRRYASVASMADDVRRYLEGYPILARPPSTVYQLRKLAQRHRTVFTGIAIGVLAIVSGASVALYEAMVAMRAAHLAEIAESNALREQTRAERHAAEASAAQRDAELARNEAEAAVEFLVEMLNSADPSERGRDVLVRDVLDDVTPTLDVRCADRPALESRLRDAIGRTYASLGQLEPARVQLSAAVDLRRRQLGACDPLTADSERHLAAVLISLGRLDEAEPYLRQASATLSERFGPDHADALAARSDLAELRRQQSQPDSAEAEFREIIASGERLFGPDVPVVQDTRGRLADLLVRAGRVHEAESVLLDLLNSLNTSGDDSSARQLSARHGLALVYRGMGRLADAISMLEPVVDARREQLGSQHPNTLGALHDLAALYTATGRVTESETLLRQIVASAEATLGPAHENTLRAQFQLAHALIRQDRLDEAHSLLDDTIAKQRLALPELHEDLAESLQAAAFVYLRADRLEESEAMYAESVRILVLRKPPEFVHTAVVRCNHALVLARLARCEDAVRAMEAAWPVLSCHVSRYRALAQRGAEAAENCERNLGHMLEAERWRDRAAVLQTSDGAAR